MRSKRTLRENNHKETGMLFLWCGVAFLATAAVALIAAYVKKLFPFGEESIYFSDLAGEYSTFLTELWRKLHTGGDIFYSWKTGIGGSFIGVFMFILSSPFNIIVLLGKESSIDETITFLIYLRQALSAVSMCCFLSKRRNGNASFCAAVCGVLYGCCGWFCGFYYNTIWLDVFMLLPLMLLGIERIIDHGRPVLYIVVLAIMLFTNFYMSYSACVFAVLYWLYYFFSHYRFWEYEEGEAHKKVPFFKSRFFTAGTIFAISSFFSLICLSVVYIPFLIHMTRNGPNTQSYSLASFSNITQQITAFFSGCAFNTGFFRGYAPVYTGVLSLAAAPLYFFHKTITRREKITGALFLLIMLLSLNDPLLDYFWHGFRYPTSLLFRESYIVPILLIMMVFRVLSQIKGVAPKSFFLLIGVAGLMIVCGIVELKTRDYTVNITKADLFITMLLFVLFAGMVFLMRYGNRSQAIVAAVFLFLGIMADCAYTFTSNISLMGYTQTEIDERREVVCDLIDRIDDESLFFRTEIAPHWMNNDGAFFDFYGVTQSSSTTAMPILQLMQDFGVDSNASNCIYYDSQTPLFNSLFGVKYLLENQDKAEEIGVTYLSCAGETYRLLETNNEYSLYRFDNALSLGFTADRSLAKWQARKSDGPGNQSSFYAAAAGSQESAVMDCEIVSVAAVSPEEQEIDVLGANKYSVKKVIKEGGTGAFPGISMTVKPKLSGMVYVFAETLGDTFTNVIIDAVNEKTGEHYYFESSTRAYTGAVYTAVKDETFDVTVFSGQDEDCDMVIKVFQIDSDVFMRQHDAIERSGELQLTEFSDAHFKGDIDVQRDNGLILLTVPYDPGWTVSLDGKELTSDDYSLVGGVLYGIPAEKGLHTVEFAYRLYGFRVGVAVSCVSVIALAVFLVVLRKKDPVPPESPEKASAEAV